MRVLVMRTSGGSYMRIGEVCGSWSGKRDVCSTNSGVWRRSSEVCGLLRQRTEIEALECIR